MVVLICNFSKLPFPSSLRLNPVKFLANTTFFPRLTSFFVPVNLSFCPAWLPYYPAANHLIVSWLTTLLSWLTILLSGLHIYFPGPTTLLSRLTNLVSRLNLSLICFKKRNYSLPTTNFISLTTISLQPDNVNFWYCKLLLLDLAEIIMQL